MTTGIAPPGTGKGREFVHDPCLTEKRDVLAQIRLLCKRSGMPLTVTRQMQLKHSEKTGKHSFKTLDVAVRFRRFNPSSGAVDEHGISYKTSEADTHVCKLMGAPQAVLAHVILCHQDESNWPLGDGASLKKKFDEIFEADRYARALEELRSVRKTEKAAQSEAEVHVATLRERRGHLERYREERIAVQEAVVAVQQVAVRAASRLNQVSARTEVLQAIATAIGDSIGKLDRARDALKDKVIAVQSARQSLSLSGDDIAEIKETLMQRRPALQPDVQAHLDDLIRTQPGTSLDELKQTAQRTVYAREYRHCVLRLQKLPEDMMHMLDDSDAAIQFLSTQRDEERSFNKNLDGLVLKQTSLRTKLKATADLAQENEQALVNASANIARLSEQEKRYLVVHGKIKADSSLKFAALSGSGVGSIASSGAGGAKSDGSAAVIAELGTAVYSDHVRLHEGLRSICSRHALALQESERHWDDVILDRQTKADRARTSLQDAKAHVQRTSVESSTVQNSHVALLDERGQIERQLLDLGSEGVVAKRSETQQKLNQLQSSADFRTAAGSVDQLMQAVQDGARKQAKYLSLIEKKQELAALESQVESSRNAADAALTEAISQLKDCCKAAGRALRTETSAILQASLLPDDEDNEAVAILPLQQLRKRLHSATSDATQALSQAQLERDLARSAHNAINEQLSAHRNAAGSAKLRCDESLRKAAAILGKHPVLLETIELVASREDAKVVECASDGEHMDDILASAWKLPCKPEVVAEHLDSATTTLDQISSKAALKPTMAPYIAEVAWDALRSMCNDAEVCCLCKQPHSSSASHALPPTPPKQFAPSVKRQIVSRQAQHSEASLARAAQDSVPVLREIITGACKLFQAVGSETDAVAVGVLDAQRTDARLRAAITNEETLLKNGNLLRDCIALLSRASECGTKANRTQAEAAAKGRALAQVRDRLGLPLDGAAQSASLQSQSASSMTVDIPHDLSSSADEIRSAYHSVRREVQVSQSRLEEAQAARRGFMQQEERLRRTLDELRDKSEASRKLQLQKQHADEHLKELESRLSELREKADGVDMVAEVDQLKTATKALEVTKSARDEAISKVRDEANVSIRRLEELEREWKRLEDEAMPRPRSMSKSRRLDRDRTSTVLQSYREEDNALTTELSACRAALDEQRRMQVLLDKVGRFHELTADRNRLEGVFAQLESHTIEAQQVAERAKLGIAPQAAAMSGAGGSEAPSEWIPEEDGRDGDLRRLSSEIRHDSALVGGTAHSTGLAAAEAPEVSTSSDEELEPVGEDDVGAKRRRRGSASGANQYPIHPDDKALDEAPSGSDLPSRLARLGIRQRGLDRLVATLDGRSREMQRRLRDLDGHLGDYEKVKLAFFRNKTASEIHKLAAGDLDTYHRNLDRALMRFHQQRIQEVNVIIRSLWQQVYRGNDIEHIEITSDVAAGATAGSGARGARSYNYRVVMRKAGASGSSSGGVTDMRGRCSAGQRVLASLVIRMALAQCLASQSGLITLDEPTTNLDAENREALAKAIARLLAARGSQPNLQLVIITHDEDFITALSRELTATGAAQHAPEHFYRLSRAADEAGGRPFSEISRGKWSDLGV